MAIDIGLWAAALWIGVLILKALQGIYVRRVTPAPRLKRGFAAVSAVVLPIGQFVDPAFKPDPNAPTEICLAGMRANLDSAQLVAYALAIWAGRWINLNGFIAGGVLVAFFIGRASSFWSAHRKIAKAQDAAKAALAAA